MIETTPKRSFVLAVYPTSRGFGWALFEGPLIPFDWGVVGARRDKNVVCLARIEKLIERYHPETLVLEAFEGLGAARTGRIRRLCRALVALATDRSVNVSIYTREHIRSAFKEVGAVSRREIAEAVSRHVDAFRHRLPPKRKPWNSEDERMSLFAAAALVLTHYRLDANQLLDRLRDT